MGIIVTFTASKGSGANDWRLIVRGSSCCLKERVLWFFTVFWATHGGWWKIASQSSLASWKRTASSRTVWKKCVCAKRGTKGHPSRKLRQDSGTSSPSFSSHDCVWIKNCYYSSLVQDGWPRCHKLWISRQLAFSVAGIFCLFVLMWKKTCVFLKEA